MTILPVDHVVGLMTDQDMVRAVGVAEADLVEGVDTGVEEGSGVGEVEVEEVMAGGKAVMPLSNLYQRGVGGRICLTGMSKEYIQIPRRYEA